MDSDLEKNVRLNIELRERSGKVSSTSKLVSFLYSLMRDGRLSFGEIEQFVRDSESDVNTLYTNGFVAKYAIDLANRLGDSNGK